MIAHSTSAFRKSLKDVKKKHRSCPTDICNLIKGKTSDELSKFGARIGHKWPFSIYKVRVGNSAANAGKRESHRLIVAIDKDNQEVILLYIYPKNGADGMDSVSADHLKFLVKELTAERDGNTLTQMNLEKELAEI